MLILEVHLIGAKIQDKKVGEKKPINLKYIKYFTFEFTMIFFKKGARVSSRLNSFIAVKSGYPLAIDDGIKISLPEIITYKHERIYWI